jgi:ABC-type antimicrobial peptide transport system permease subunit
VLAGFLISLFGGRILAAWLFGVTATDPTAFMSAVGAILFAALLAAYLAARRASRVDPMVALRYD